MPQNKRILIINPFGIGDVLFSTPLIRNLKYYYPDAYIGYCCGERIAPVLENNPNIDKVIPFTRGDFKRLWQQSKLKAVRISFKYLREILSCQFNLYFDLSLEHRYSLLLKLLGVKRRIGFNFQNRGRFLTDKINIKGYEDKHIIEYYLDLLRLVHLKPKYRNLEVFLSTAEVDWARSFLREKKPQAFLVGIVPGGGASWGAMRYLKHWPAERFARVCDALVERFNAQIIVFADKSESRIGRTVVDFMRHPCIDAVGKTDLRQFIALLAQCEMIITNDGGPLHLSVALDRKTISIFGLVDARIYGPYPSGPRHIVVKGNFAPRFYYRNFKLPEYKYAEECLQSISADEVLGAAEKLLKR